MGLGLAVSNEKCVGHFKQSLLLLPTPAVEHCPPPTATEKLSGVCVSYFSEVACVFLSMCTVHPTTRREKVELLSQSPSKINMFLQPSSKSFQIQNQWGVFEFVRHFFYKHLFFSFLQVCTFLSSVSLNHPTIIYRRTDCNLW